MKILSTIPVNSILYKQSINSSYTDSVKIITHRDDIQSWELIGAFFNSAPFWMKYLLSARNSIVKHFGVKSGSINIENIYPPFKAGQNLGGFKIYSVNPTEAIIGEDDVHLNFRISFIVDKKNGNELAMSTIVNINNSFGKVYMFFIKPIHRILIPRMMKKMNILINEKSLPYYEQEKT